MRYDDVAALRRQSPAWRLLMADHAPLMLSFLGKVFVEENVRSISAGELTARLDEELFSRNATLGDGTFPRTARAYLDTWADPENGWLRKYYPPGVDEPHYDATPAVERALSWVESLSARSFVGTESRLHMVVELLRQMVLGSEADPQVRLRDLHRRRQEIDLEIARAEAGDVVIMDGHRFRDRYQQVAATARALLSDFREVEANFRRLDRDLRERIASWDGSKGDLLDEMLGDRTSIADSDQGRSFHAFYDFLLSPRAQEELSDLLEQANRLAGDEDRDLRLRTVHHDWLGAAEQTQETVRLLSEQLRRFLDDRAWLENRRVIEILRGIDRSALALRGHRVDRAFEIDATSPHLNLPFERPLYRSSPPSAIDSTPLRAADAQLDAAALLEQVHVDQQRLAANVRHALQRDDQVMLHELVERRPVEHGLAEVVAYLALVDSGFRVVFDDTRREQVSWLDEHGARRAATMPAVTFVRNRGARVVA